jgi:S1-C subfamily serine protease
VLVAGIGIGRAASGGAPSAARTPTRAPAIGAHAAPTVAVAPSAQDLQQTIENVIHTVQPSVVEVTSEGAIGSGDILTTDGYIVTNDHVVQGFNTFSVTLSSGKTLPAQVVGQDAQDDLAVLKVSITNAQPIALADSSKVQVGEFAIAVGNPLGLQQSATLGIVSALNRTASEGPQGPAPELTGLIQTSAPINPGNSGGALVDLHGQLIGIPTLGVTDQQTGGTADGIGFAIASNRVKYVANQLIQNGKLTSTGQGFLGIQSEDVTPQLAAANGLSVQSGALVAGFAPDTAGTSPAQAAGMRVGDVIVAVDAQAVASGSDLASILFGESPGTRVTLSVVRGSSHLTIPVTLGERPTSAQG